MTKLETTRTKLINSAFTALREYEAILVLGFGIDQSKRVEIEKERSLINTWNNRGLRDYIQDKTETIAKLRKDLHVLIERDELIRRLELVEAAPSGKSAFVTKAWLEEVFGPNGILKELTAIPEHTRIAISKDRDQAGTYDWWLPAAMLYEDMCLLFNLAMEDSKTKALVRTQKRATKTTRTLFNTAALTAFYFVEAYLNGLAFDYAAKNGNTLDAKAQIALQEWNDASKKTKYLSLRDKVRKYVQIITASPNPPLDDSNCPELVFMASTERESETRWFMHPHGRTFKEEVPQKLTCSSLLNEKISKL
jgi:hypothetical protein